MRVVVAVEVVGVINHPVSGGVAVAKCAVVRPNVVPRLAYRVEGFVATAAVGSVGTAKVDTYHSGFVTSVYSNIVIRVGQNGAGTHFPLYLYKNSVKVPNLNKVIWEKIDKITNESWSPEDIFDYVYGVLHSPKYRKTYNEFLRGDFPKIPYPKDFNNFVKFKDKGNILRKLHLYQNLPSNIAFAILQGEGDNMIIKPTYKNGRVYINKKQYFDNVSLEIWEMQIGDDQPAERWLKERKGLILTPDDILFYQKIIYILYKTKEIMESID